MTDSAPDASLTVQFVSIDDLTEDLSEELQVVFSILEAEEIFVLSVIPLCLELTVKSPEMENCSLELKIMIPQGYPAEASLKVRTFIKCKWAITEDTVTIEKILKESILLNEGCPQMYELICAAQSFLDETLVPMKKVRKSKQSYVAATKPICKFFNYSQKNQNVNDLEQKLRAKVEKTITKLQCTSSDAIKHLRGNKWKVPGKNAKAGDSTGYGDSGLSPPPMRGKKSFFDIDDVRIAQPTVETYNCNVCMDKYPVAEGMSLSCGHWACLDCFTGYLESQISSGELAPKCVGCSQTVPETLIVNLVSAKSYGNAKNSLIKNYTNQYKKFKTCPSNGCQTVFYFTGGKDLEAFPFSACENCQTCFCSDCMRPSHWPLKCKDVAATDSMMSSYVSSAELPDTVLLTEESIGRLYRKLTTEFRIAYKKWLNKLFVDLDIGRGNRISDRLNRPQFEQMFISSFYQENENFEWASSLLRSMEPIFWKYSNHIKDFMKYIDELSGIQQELLVPELLVTLRERYGFDQVATDKVLESIQKRRKRDKFHPEQHIVTIESKPCPACGTPWVKNGGCKHMHCRTCGHHFCWDCGQPFTQDTHPSFFECRQAKKVRQKKTAMVLASHEENEFAQLKREEALQRNDGVGLGISFQVLNQCDEMLVKLRNTLNDSKKLSLFSKKSGTATKDIALIISTVRLGYMVLRNGYRRHIFKSSLSRFSETFMTMQELEYVLERFDTFSDEDPTYFPLRNTLKWSTESLLQAIERTMMQYQEHFLQPELPPEQTYVPSRFNADRETFDNDKYGTRV